MRKRKNSLEKSGWMIVNTVLALVVLAGFVNGTTTMESSTGGITISALDDSNITIEAGKGSINHESNLTIGEDIYLEKSTYPSILNHKTGKIVFDIDADESIYNTFNMRREVGDPSKSIISLANTGYPMLHMEGDENSSKGARIRVFPGGNETLEMDLWFRHDDAAYRGFTFRADESNDKYLLPWTTKEYDIGSGGMSWDDCYCDDFHTTSSGWLPVEGSMRAIDAIKTIKVKHDGQLDHDALDLSFNTDGTNETFNLMVGITANSQAILELEETVNELRSELCSMGKSKYCG